VPSGRIVATADSESGPTCLVAFIGELGAGPGEHVRQQTSRTAGAGANSCFTESGWRVIGL